MKKLVSIGVFFCLGIGIIQAQVPNNEVVKANEVVLPPLEKFQYEFVNVVLTLKNPSVDLRLGKKYTRNAKIKKSWLARNFGIRKVDFNWRNVSPVNNKISNNLHWFQLFHFLPKAQNIFGVSELVK